MELFVQSSCNSRSILFGIVTWLRSESRTTRRQACAQIQLLSEVSASQAWGEKPMGAILGFNSPRQTLCKVHKLRSPGQRRSPCHVMFSAKFLRPRSSQHGWPLLDVIVCRSPPPSFAWHVVASNRSWQSERVGHPEVLRSELVEHCASSLYD